MFRSRLAAAALTAALAVVPATALSAGADAAVTPPATSPVYGICVSSAVVLKQPGKGFLATLSRGETIKVKRLSHSGKYAYGFARGTATRTAGSRPRPCARAQAVSATIACRARSRA